jgi:glutathione S-transferase
VQLWYAPTSPFARKVRIVAHELGLADRIELVEVNPWTDERLRALNPLAKVPTLVCDDGVILYESAIICEYFDDLAGGGLYPSGPARWPALLRQGLADGVNTASGRLFADEQRAPQERSERMMQRFRAAIDGGLDQIDAGQLATEQPGIGEIAVAAALGYLDFRWPDRDWRGRRAALAGWFDRFEQRPSMAATRHHLPVLTRQL